MGKNNDLTKGPVVPKLISLTIPMVFGMFSMVAFNIIDTFFISRLGTKELAAMGFTFPIIMLVASVALGLGVATASVVSRAIGRGDHHKVQRFTTDSLMLALFLVILFTLAGLFTMDRVFILMGATADILVFIKQYMKVWYIGVIFVVIPMVGNNAIRAGGDTLFPSLIMVFSTIINIILDPLLIFGLAGFPRLELAGAALATVIARFFSLIFSLLILHFREKLIDWSLPKLHEFIDSARRILYVGFPSASSRILLPVAMAVVMRMVAKFGHAAVAAVGVAVRIEMFVFMVIMALATALIPFIGQNWGAKEFVRVRTACLSADKFAFWWGLGNFFIFFIFAGFLGELFGKEAAVSQNIVYYLRIIPFSYALQGVFILTGSVFNAINKPFLSLGLTLIQMFLLYIPFAYIGSLWFGLTGLFAGLCLANIIGGFIAISWNKKVVLCTA